MSQFPSSSIELFAAVGFTVLDERSMREPEIVDGSYVVFDQQDAEGGGGTINFGQLETKLAEFQMTEKGVMLPDDVIKAKAKIALNQSKAELLPKLKAYYKSAVIALNGRAKVGASQVYTPLPNDTLPIIERFDFDVEKYELVDIALKDKQKWLSSFVKTKTVATKVKYYGARTEQASIRGTMQDPFVGYSTTHGGDAVHANTSSGDFASGILFIYSKKIDVIPEEGLPELIPNVSKVEKQKEGMVLVTNSSVLLEGQDVALTNIGIVKDISDVQPTDIILLNNVVGNDVRLDDGYVLNVATGEKSKLLSIIKGATHGS